MIARMDQEESAVLEALRAGDHAAFSALSERHRRRLRAHCYRMLGSFDDAEDVVQETLLSAWRSRASFQGRSRFATWLFSIATNACLKLLERAPRRVLPSDVAPPITPDTPESHARSAPSWAPELPWLQPVPDALLEAPDAALASRESVELAFIAALQHLPARQRAMLILCDVVGWSAHEVADLLEVSVASVTSTVQRAHATVRGRLPAGREGWAPNLPLSEPQQAALQRFMDAWERGDVSVLTDVLASDARWTMPPAPLWFEGRAAIEKMLALFPPRWQGREFRMVPAGANRQPAAAAYLRPAGETLFRLSSLHVLRVEGAQINEITTFSAGLCARFSLPATL